MPPGWYEYKDHRPRCGTEPQLSVNHLAEPQAWMLLACAVSLRSFTSMDADGSNKSPTTTPSRTFSFLPFADKQCHHPRNEHSHNDLHIEYYPHHPAFLLAPQPSHQPLSYNHLLVILAAHAPAHTNSSPQHTTPCIDSNTPPSSAAYCKPHAHLMHNTTRHVVLPTCSILQNMTMYTTTAAAAGDQLQEQTMN